MLLIFSLCANRIVHLYAKLLAILRKTDGRHFTEHGDNVFSTPSEMIGKLSSVSCRNILP